MDMRDVARYAYETGQLKRLPRAGWALAGITDSESVAEHSYRVGILAYMIAVLEGANPDRAATLGLFHDVPETRIGDVPSVGKPYVSTPPAQAIAADQVAGLPEILAKHISALIDEHESAKEPHATAEARCSRDADKLECLLQAREYQAQGNTQMQPWIDSMVAAVSTETGKRLAAAAQELPPGAWWAEFAANFGKNSRHPEQG
jgi:putative hydrolases of HD superfamily